MSVTPTLEARNLERNIKRESNYGYMLANGSIVTDCGLGAIFTINDGKLTNEFGVLSTSPGISYAQFESSPVPASITTTFSLVGPLLQWSNPIFDGGFAKYCATPERTVDMIFSGPFPTDCVEVYLLVIGRECLCKVIIRNWS